MDQIHGWGWDVCKEGYVSNPNFLQRSPASLAWPIQTNLVPKDMCEKVSRVVYLILIIYKITELKKNLTHTFNDASKWKWRHFCFGW